MQEAQGHWSRRKKKGSSSEMTELVVNVGKLNGLSPKTLMNMVNVADRDSSVDVGRINIVKMQAFFEVPRDKAQRVTSTNRDVSTIKDVERNPLDRIGVNTRSILEGDYKLCIVRFT